MPPRAKKDAINVIIIPETNPPSYANIPKYAAFALEEFMDVGACDNPFFIKSDMRQMTKIPVANVALGDDVVSISSGAIPGSGSDASVSQPCANVRPVSTVPARRNNSNSARQTAPLSSRKRVHTVDPSASDSGSDGDYGDGCIDSEMPVPLNSDSGSDRGSGDSNSDSEDEMSDSHSQAPPQMPPPPVTTKPMRTRKRKRHDERHVSRSVPPPNHTHPDGHRHHNQPQMSSRSKRPPNPSFRSSQSRTSDQPHPAAIPPSGQQHPSSHMNPLFMDENGVELDREDLLLFVEKQQSMYPFAVTPDDPKGVTVERLRRMITQNARNMQSYRSSHMLRLAFASSLLVIEMLLGFLGHVNTGRFMDFHYSQMAYYESLIMELSHQWQPTSGMSPFMQLITAMFMYTALYVFASWVEKWFGIDIFGFVLRTFGSSTKPISSDGTGAFQPQSFQSTTAPSAVPSTASPPPAAQKPQFYSFATSDPKPAAAMQPSVNPIRVPPPPQFNHNDAAESTSG